MRPTRYCAKCGEYVADGTRSQQTGYREFRIVQRLIHIDADGNEIFRNHVPVEE